jgi:Rrf2 family protein
VYLADQLPAAKTTDQVAQVTRVPAAYLSKVLQALSRAGIVRSQRGVKGGFQLARGSQEISILDVVNAVDPIRRIEACPLGLASHGPSLCSLHNRLDAALASVEESFRNTSLADILADQTGTVPLCDVVRNGEEFKAKVS